MTQKVAKWGHGFQKGVASHRSLAIAGSVSVLDLASMPSNT